MIWLLVTTLGAMPSVCKLASPPPHPTSTITLNNSGGPPYNVCSFSALSKSSASLHVAAMILKLLVKTRGSIGFVKVILACMQDMDELSILLAKRTDDLEFVEAEFLALQQV